MPTRISSSPSSVVPISNRQRPSVDVATGTGEADTAPFLNDTFEEPRGVEVASEEGTKKAAKVSRPGPSAPKGQYRLVVDPKVTGPERKRLEAVAEKLNTPEGQRLLRMPNRGAKGGTIMITTRPEAFMGDNVGLVRQNLEKGGKYFRGFSQGTNNELPKTIFLNLESDKEPFRVLVHELAHIKCPGLAKDNPNGDHSPEFYRLVSDTLSALGVEPNAKDRNDIDISRARSPAGDVSPLDWYPGYKR